MTPRFYLRLRLARLHVQAWALRHNWTGDWVYREDALEDVDAEMRQVRFQLAKDLASAERHPRETARVPKSSGR